MVQMDTGSLKLGDQTEFSYFDYAIRQSRTIPISQLAMLALITWFLARNFLPPSDGVSVRSVGRRSVLEPSLIVRMRFALGALDQISEGYRKVSEGASGSLRGHILTQSSTKMASSGSPETIVT